jgi:hypothetical protein
LARNTFTERSALDTNLWFAFEIYDGCECPGRPYDNGCSCVDEALDWTDIGSFGSRAVAENAIVRVATERMP